MVSKSKTGGPSTGAMGFLEKFQGSWGQRSHFTSPCSWPPVCPKAWACTASGGSPLPRAYVKIPQVSSHLEAPARNFSSFLAIGTWHGIGEHSLPGLGRRLILGHMTRLQPSSPPPTPVRMLRINKLSDHSNYTRVC